MYIHICAQTKSHISFTLILLAHSLDLIWRSSIMECIKFNPCPAESGYTLPLQTVPTDLDLHYLPLSMCIYSNNPDQVI